MAISAEGMIEIWPWRNFGKKWTGIFGQRAEVEAVDGWSEKLYRSVSDYQHFMNMTYVKPQKTECTYDPEK